MRRSGVPHGAGQAGTCPTMGAYPLAPRYPIRAGSCTLHGARHSRRNSYKIRTRRSEEATPVNVLPAQRTATRSHPGERRPPAGHRHMKEPRLGAGGNQTDPRYSTRGGNTQTQTHTNTHNNQGLQAASYHTTKPRSPGSSDPDPRITSNHGLDPWIWTHERK
ncbi:unnamed protein product [Pleuronectes platessa]|uniref:Uncharacterized protein n=1 Tax=Pleuronectes platessa TaxID=8262 RepID=A0A9N7TN36_PLEPL|nr:unnamed protein product [Pleuronectes platessa]